MKPLTSRQYRQWLSDAACAAGSGYLHSRCTDSRSRVREEALRDARNQFDRIALPAFNPVPVPCIGGSEPIG